jgi:hypothetical protein
VLYWDAVCVPTETAWYVESRDVSVACDNVLPSDRRFPVSGWDLNEEIKYLDGTSEQMPVMRKAGSERRPIVKGVDRATLR